jgi:hypothetical protein
LVRLLKGRDWSLPRSAFSGTKPLTLLMDFMPPRRQSRARIVDNAQQCSFAEEFRRLLDPNSGRRGGR